MKRRTLLQALSSLPFLGIASTSAEAHLDSIKKNHLGEYKSIPDLTDKEIIDKITSKIYTESYESYYHFPLEKLGNEDFIACPIYEIAHNAFYKNKYKTRQDIINYSKKVLLKTIHRKQLDDVIHTFLSVGVDRGISLNKIVQGATNLVSPEIYEKYMWSTFPNGEKYTDHMITVYDFGKDQPYEKYVVESLKRNKPSGEFGLAIFNKSILIQPTWGNPNLEFHKNHRVEYVVENGQFVQKITVVEGMDNETWTCNHYMTNLAFTQDASLLDLKL